jgi:hypothetical protein
MKLDTEKITRYLLEIELTRSGKSPLPLFAKEG